METNYISFDVGIKNMAYCIFSIQNKSIQILDWNIINLIETNHVDYKCNAKIISKSKKNPIDKICNKKAKYKKDTNYFCETHAKSNKEHIIPTKNHTLSFLKKQKVDSLTKIYCSQFLFSENDNKKLKKDELVEKIHTLYEKKCYENLNQKKGPNANNVDLINIGKQIKIKMNEIPNINNIHYVIIENQISPIANRMKTIQGMLAQYFIMINDIVHIDFVSSSNKLKQFNELNIKNEIIEKNTYKENKKDGIYYCKLIIKNNIFCGKWENALDIKKKDDLSDAFLQGIWYLKKENIIYYADDLKINIV
tara:strand:- start:114 stop:1037 length:924 start_codon:yes stop_codon:yes gene_type:complete